MIESFTLENFKSFKKATLPLAPLTLLVGPNASGKSNAIEALQLMTWLVSGEPLDKLLYAVREREIAVRGNYLNLFGDPNSPLSITATMRVDFTDADLSYKVDLVKQNDSAAICGELVRFGSNRISYLDSGRHTQNTALARYQGDELNSLPKDSWTQRDWGGPFAARYLKKAIFLTPDPARMRGYTHSSERALRADGSNLSSVLKRLVEEGLQDEILKFVESLPEQKITGIKFIETAERGDVMVQLVEDFGGRPNPRDAAILSDGTLRVLSVAAAVLSVPESSLVVIEEMDNGVHPSRAKLLLDNLYRVARERNIKILLTTHNPALQNALPLEAVPDVVACYRDPDTGESKLQRLGDMELYPHLTARGSLGTLSTSGTLEKFLKDRTTPEERRAKEREWIERLRLRTGT